MTIPLSRNVTEPVGSPAPFPDAVTDAVKVTACPTTLFAVLVVIAVVVVDCETLWASAVELLLV
jgi:hypothetical protein